MWFDHAQRAAKLQFRNGDNVTIFDSHTSIATYYGVDEDTWNKYEYDVFTQTLTRDQQNTEDDREAVEAFIAAITPEQWHALCGDLDGIRALLEEIKHIDWFSGKGELPEGIECKLYDTRAAAYDAARAAACDAAYDAAYDAACAAAYAAACDAACDAALQARVMVCDGLPLEQKHIDHARKRWEVWKAGYGEFVDVDGVLYCYRRVV